MKYEFLRGGSDPSTTGPPLDLRMHVPVFA